MAQECSVYFTIGLTEEDFHLSRSRERKAIQVEDLVNEHETQLRQIGEVERQPAGIDSIEKAGDGARTRDQQLGRL
jgi:hypothetical protein